MLLFITAALGASPETIIKWLVEEGNESNIEATGDYSSVAKSFVYEVPVGFRLEVHRLLIHIEDSGGMRAEHYGTLGEALTNGIIVESLTSDDVLDVDMTDGHPIKTNANWSAVCGPDHVALFEWGAGDELLGAVWHFSDSGRPFVVPATEHFTVRVQDDLTGLVSHQFMIQGVLFDLGDSTP